ncbi:MAG: MBL fold metallo-hydrolase [Synergistetes bacterium]|nr:MBL fold metallo-hydrolase [Synergistota bacterium]MCX8127145.1 MBL fold metallo-hydrolase [Synergistota bacterium]MDW8191969.1 MBL fold metallo-hydrolase [Synergistota bacterium]
MILKRWVLGELASNAYLLADEINKVALVVDPGGDPWEIIDFLKRAPFDLKYILNTHGHADHIAGNAALKRAFENAKILIHEEDASMLTSPALNLSIWLGSVISSPKADMCLSNGDLIELGNFKIEVIHTPGHTPGSVCFYVKDVGILFSGDTLFCRSVGRTDFPGSSWEALISSIRNKLFRLPKITKVYPGHGEETTIEEEMYGNPFLV